MGLKSFLMFETVTDLSLCAILLANVARNFSMKLPFGARLAVDGLNSGLSSTGYRALIAVSVTFVAIVFFTSTYVFEKNI